MSRRPIPALTYLLGAMLDGVAGAGRAALSAMARTAPPPTFGMRYGANPKAYNGGTRTGAAAHKRAAHKRRNIRKHPRAAR